MGEQSHQLISGHLWSPMMRSSRGKLFVYLAIIGVMCFIVFLLRNTRSSLKQLEGINDKCQQQRDSYSAQLQVVYEHKNRVEKYLQDEKTEHKHTREEFEEITNKKNQDLKIYTAKEKAFEKQISDLKSSNADVESDKKQVEDTFKEQLETLQSQKDEELKKLQAQVNELLVEKDKIEQARTSLALKVEDHMNEMSTCHLQKQRLEENLSICENELKKSQASNQKLPPNAIVSQLQAEKVTNQVQEQVRPSPDSPLSKDKPSVLVRPHLQQSPEKKDTETKKDPKESPLKDLDPGKNPAPEENADETKNNSHTNVKHHQLPIPLLLGNSITPEDKKDYPYLANKMSLNDLPKPAPNEPADGDNLPQVQPPEGVNQPGEKGEYINGILPGQLEQPDNHNEQGVASNLKKNIFVPPNNINEQGANDAAQVQDMLDKSPGDTNDIQDPRIPLPHAANFQAAIDKMNLNKESHLAKGRAELPDDKPYVDEDEDDQDGDNEDEMGAGAGQPVRGKVFNERDFEEQDPNENNAKEEEGVIVAPK